MHSFRVANADRTVRVYSLSLSTVRRYMKECTKYEVSTTAQTFEKSKQTCRQMGGTMASNELTDSGYAAKATEAVESYRASTSKYPIWIGVYAKESINENTDFYFLNR